MNALLSHIKGKTIEWIEKTPDWHISFGDTYLAIYNPMTIEPSEKGSDLAAMRGLVVEDVHECGSELRIVMSGNVALRIDLRSEAYAGPEAMVLTTPSASIVW